MLSAISAQVTYGAMASFERIVVVERNDHASPRRVPRQRFCARHPQHVARALVVDGAARDEQEIRQAVDVAAAPPPRRSSPGVGELDDQALGAPADGAREMQIGGGRRAARQHEGAQRRELGVERVDLVLRAASPARLDGEPLAARALALVGRAEVGAEVEQIVLDARQHGVDAGASPVCRRARPIAALASSTVP